MQLRGKTKWNRPFICKLAENCITSPIIKPKIELYMNENQTPEEYRDICPFTDDEFAGKMAKMV